MEIVFDYSKADPKAHNYAVKKLREEFGEHGKCTLADYIRYYCEKLPSEIPKKGDSS